MPSDAVNEPFREVVGALMHLTTATRPDIAFAVGYVSVSMKNLQVEHWASVKRMLRYVQATKSHRTCFLASRHRRLSWLLRCRLSGRPFRPQVNFWICLPANGLHSVGQMLMLSQLKICLSQPHFKML